LALGDIAKPNQENCCQINSSVFGRSAKDHKTFLFGLPVNNQVKPLADNHRFRFDASMSGKSSATELAAGKDCLKDCFYIQFSGIVRG